MAGTKYLLFACQNEIAVTKFDFACLAWEQLSTECNAIRCDELSRLLRPGSRSAAWAPSAGTRRWASLLTGCTPCWAGASSYAPSAGGYRGDYFLMDGVSNMACGIAKAYAVGSGHTVVEFAGGSAFMIPRSHGRRVSLHSRGRLAMLFTLSKGMEIAWELFWR